MMLRKPFILIFSSALAFGIVPAFAQQQAAQAVRAAVPSEGQLLNPGPAAGVKEAQGAERNRLWNWAPFALVGGLALLVVLMGEDDDSSVTTPGTN